MDKILFLKKLKILLFYIVILFVNKTYIWCAFSVNMKTSYKINVPYIYDTILMPQYIDSLKGRVVYNNRLLFFLSLRYAYQGIFFSLGIPYETIYSEQDNSNFGDINFKSGINIFKISNVSCNLSAWVDIPGTNGKNKYLTECNVSSGAVRAGGNIMFHIDWTPWNMHSEIDFSIIKTGKTKAEKEYDISNNYSYGTSFQLKGKNSIKTKWFDLKFSGRILYKNYNYDNYEQKKIEKSNLLITDIGFGGGLPLYKNTYVNLHYVLNKYWIPYNLKISHNIDFTIKLYFDI